MNDAVVVGAGLAGLSCAVALAAERMRRPATSSTSGRVVHSEYDNFLGFLGRLGPRHLITWQPKKLITIAWHPPTVLRHRPLLPPPLSLLPDLARSPDLGLHDLWSNNRPT